MSRFTVSISNFVQMVIPSEPLLLSFECTISPYKSINAPVLLLPLQAYPVMYFSKAIISSTDGFLGSLFETIIEISPFATQPCVWYCECRTSVNGLWASQVSDNHFCLLQLQDHDELAYQVLIQCQIPYGILFQCFFFVLFAFSSFLCVFFVLFFILVFGDNNQNNDVN